MLELVILDLALIVILACLPRREARRSSSVRREAKELLRSRRPPRPAPARAEATGSVGARGARWRAAFRGPSALLAGLSLSAVLVAGGTAALLPDGYTAAAVSSPESPRAHAEERCAPVEIDGPLWTAPRPAAVDVSRHRSNPIIGT